MGKREIKKSIKDLIKYTVLADICQNESMEDITSKITELEEACENYGIDLGVDFEAMKNDTIRFSLENNEAWGDFKNSIQVIAEEAEEYCSDLSESRAEVFEDEVVCPLNEIRDMVEDVDHIETEDDIQELVNDVIERLKDI